MSESSPREKIIELTRPVEHDGTTILELRLRPPTFGEYRRAMLGATPAEQTANLVAAVSGVKREALERLDVDAVLEANEFLLGFIERGRQTGLN